ncbi:MAG: hypothetical protein JWO91_2030 [Acidobacteriaceae bacterium]|nr:hypothetical protein [Acidobacteriaceae bacterium]
MAEIAVAQLRRRMEVESRRIAPIPIPFVVFTSSFAIYLDINMPLARSIFCDERGFQRNNPRTCKWLSNQSLFFLARSLREAMF